jgi:phage shock protein A
MKLFKKLAININSGIDTMADRFENREALSKAYIREYEKTAARAKVRLARVEQEVLRLENEYRDSGEKIQIWSDRALRIHSSDEDKALVCVARMKKCQQHQQEIQQNLENARGLKAKMDRDVDHILKKLNAHQHRHQNLADRQVCAEAFHAVQYAETGLDSDIDELFVRWETDVVAGELSTQLPDLNEDTLDHEFDTIEQEQALREELEKIIATPKPDMEK